MNGPSKCRDCPAETAWESQRRTSRLLVEVMTEDVPVPVAQRRLDRIATEIGAEYADALRSDLRAEYVKRHPPKRAKP